MKDAENLFSGKFSSSTNVKYAPQQVKLTGTRLTIARVCTQVIFVSSGAPSFEV